MKKIISVFAVAVVGIGLAGCANFWTEAQAFLTNAQTVVTVAGDVLDATCTNAPQVESDLNTVLTGGANAQLQADSAKVQGVCGAAPADEATVAAALQAAEADIQAIVSATAPAATN